jgi:hypothetical protein
VDPEYSFLLLFFFCSWKVGSLLASGMLDSRRYDWRQVGNTKADRAGDQGVGIEIE